MISFERLLYVFFPTTCIYCGKLCEKRKNGFCQQCYDSLSIFLRKTGYTWYIFDYDKNISRILKKAKYGGNPGADKELGGLIGELLKKKGINPDIIIPVPMYKKDLGERGYNQSEIAARRIGKILKVPCIEKALFKTKKTKKQAELSKNARKRNLHGAFEADTRRVKNKNILLVDDIITTGSTLDECRETLFDSGAANVEAAVIAHTPFRK